MAIREKKKIHVKTGDQVVVISGKDASAQGKVLSVEGKSGRVVVEKVNMISRHTKPTQANPQGGIIRKEAPIDSSNVMLYCPKCNKGVRVKKQLLADGKKIRVCAICGNPFDKE